MRQHQQVLGLRHAAHEVAALGVHDAVALAVGADHLEGVALREEAVDAADHEHVVVLGAAQVLRQADVHDVRVLGPHRVGDGGLLEFEQALRRLIAHHIGGDGLELADALGADGLHETESAARGVLLEEVLAGAPLLGQRASAQERLLRAEAGVAHLLERLVQREALGLGEVLQAHPGVGVRQRVVEAAPAAPCDHVGGVGQQPQLRVRYERAGARGVARVARKRAGGAGGGHVEAAAAQHLLHHHGPAAVGDDDAGEGFARIVLAVHQLAQVLRQAVELVLGRVPLDGLHALRQALGPGGALDGRGAAGDVGAVHVAFGA